MLWGRFCQRIEEPQPPKRNQGSEELVRLGNASSAEGAPGVAPGWVSVADARRRSRSQYVMTKLMCTRYSLICVFIFHTENKKASSSSGGRRRAWVGLAHMMNNLACNLTHNVNSLSETAVESEESVEFKGNLRLAETDEGDDKGADEWDTQQ
ncbi:hypothetical protein FQN60_015763, partial [Etheostoma spectabile]